MFDRLGIGTVKGKSTCYPDFAAVLDHLSKGKGNEIGLGATMVIVESASKGVRFVGTLSEKIQNFTTYAAVLSDNKVSSASQEFVRYLTPSAAKAIFSSAKIA